VRALIEAEVLKLRTMRSPLILLACAQALVVVGVSGLFVGGADADSGKTVAGALAHVGVAGLFPLMLGIMAVAGEYRHRTITDTYLSTPRRSPVIGAKVLVYGAVGLAMGVLGTLTAVVATAIWMSAKGGGSLSLSDPDVWQTAVGCIVQNGLFAAIGVGVGALVRNLVGAVAATLAWVAVVEGVVGELLGGGLTRWLPFAAGEALGKLGAVSDGLPQVGAGVLLAGYAAAFTLAALLSSVRRDVA
jgi:ABC-2 type transport system permease protein